MKEYAWNIKEIDLEKAGFANAMEQKTKMGRLVVNRVCDKHYPGFQISINRQNVNLQIALVEVDQSEKNPVLKAHVYSADERIDEPIYDYSVKKRIFNPAAKRWQYKSGVLSLRIDAEYFYGSPDDMG